MSEHPHPARFTHSLPTSLRGPAWRPRGRRSRGREARARRRLKAEYRDEHTHKPDPKKPRERKPGSPSFRQ